MINTREVAKEYRLSHWAGIMQERVQKGQSIKEYCLEIGICQNTYFYWQRRVRAAACEQLALKPESIQANQPVFTEVKVSGQLTLPAAETPPVRVEYKGIQIFCSYRPDELAVLLRELARP